eukprot:jgi/Psemu1/23635/gm1.23635_g
MELLVHGLDTKEIGGRSCGSGGAFALPDLVTNLYHIHFDFDKNIVTLSPSQLGKVKICLAPTTIKEEIILARYLVEKFDELLLAKLEVVFLSQSNVANIDDHLDVAGGEVYLTDVFKHLEGKNFKYHTLSDFKTWDCSKKTKGDLQKFKESQTCLYEEYSAGWAMFSCKTREPLYRGFIPPWLVQERVIDADKTVAKNSNESGNNGDNVSNPSHDKGNNCDDGSLDSNTGLKPAAKNSNEYGNNGDKRGEAQCKKKGKLLEDGESESFSDSTKLLLETDTKSSFDSKQQVSEYNLSTHGSSDNEKDLELDPDNNGESEGENDDKC